MDRGQTPCSARSPTSRTSTPHKRLDRARGRDPLGTGVASVHADRVELDDGTTHPHPHRRLGRRRVGGCDRRRTRAADRPRRTDLTYSRTSPSTDFPGVYAVGDVANIPGSRRHDAAPARLGRPAGRQLGRGRTSCASCRGEPHEAVPLQGQGHHGDDRPQRRRRRGRQAPAPGRGPDRVRRLARRPRHRCSAARTARPTPSSPGPGTTSTATTPPPSRRPPTPKRIAWGDDDADVPHISSTDRRTTPTASRTEEGPRT